jgi:DDE superfamily endonuclease
LQALNFLYRYDVESEREPKFDRSPKTMREWVWYYVKKIAALKDDKIFFPDDFGDDTWIMTVDCTDCPIEEIAHPVLSQDPELYSFKLNGAGLRYELGIDLFYSNLIWLNGPFKPGQVNDNTIFAEKGLKAKLESIGKKALADKIYNGHPNECSTFNAVDSEVVSKFKARAQMRHEQFNGMVKEFKCMANEFRHKPEKEKKHKACMEAVCVVCQYRLENGEPLFDLMAGL